MEVRGLIAHAGKAFAVHGPSRYDSRLERHGKNNPGH